jgi:hypothetical protein
MGTWESFGTLENSELDYRGQNTLPLRVFYTFGKVLKCRCCRKWPRMSHSNIYSMSYVRKKGWKLNWQFDSWPLKVGNRLDFLACRQRATYRWKALDEGYNFALDLIAIEGLHKKLCAFKIAGVHADGISRLPLGSPGTKSHLDVAPVERHRIYYKGEGGGFPQVRAVMSLVCSGCPWLVLAPKVVQLCINHFVLVLWRSVWVSKLVTSS